MIDYVDKYIYKPKEKRKTIDKCFAKMFNTIKSFESIGNGHCKLCHFKDDDLHNKQDKKYIVLDKARIDKYKGNITSATRSVV